MTNGLLRGSLLVLLISLYWGKRFSREHTKNPNANVRAQPDVTFGLWDIIPPPPQSQLAFHNILFKIWEHTYMQKGYMKMEAFDQL